MKRNADFSIILWFVEYRTHLQGQVEKVVNKTKQNKTKQNKTKQEDKTGQFTLNEIFASSEVNVPNYCCMFLKIVY